MEIIEMKPLDVQRIFNLITTNFNALLYLFNFV
jgi:hypothetical protein